MEVHADSAEQQILSRNDCLSVTELARVALGLAMQEVRMHSAVQ